MPSISINECLSFGWRAFKARPMLFVLVPIIVMLVTGLVSAITGFFTSMLGETPAQVADFIISVPVNTLASLGVLTLYLKAHDDIQSAKLSDLWSPKLFLPFLATSVLMSIIVIGGYILLIVPGVILSLALMFSTYICVEKGTVTQALKESMRITKGHRWNLLYLSGAILGINIIGAICLLIGLFVSIPVSMMAVTHAYRQLSGTTHVAAAPALASVAPAMPEVNTAAPSVV